MEEQIFEQFRNESLDQLKTLQPSKVRLFKSDPISENFTLVAKIDETSLRTIEALIAELKQLEPNQYYYPLENMHLTIIGNIPIETRSSVIVSALENILPKYKLVFQLKGLASNNYCSSVSAYPSGFSLHELREELRNMIGAHGDDFTCILQSYEYVGWINYLRYLQIPSQAFLDKLHFEKDTFFGQLKPSVIQLYRNTSKVLDPKDTVLIKEFNLESRS